MDKQFDINALFQQAKTDPVEYSFDEIKDSFLKASAPIAAGKGGIFTIKKGLIMLAIISTCTALFIVVSGSDKTNNTNDVSVIEESSFQETLIEDTDTLTKDRKNNIEVVSEEDLLAAEVTESPTDFILDITEKGDPLPPVMKQKVPEVKLPKPKISMGEPSDKPYIPTLTEEQIKTNNKRKKKMMKAASTFNKKQWVYVPSGSFSFKGKPASVQAFYVQKTEVTNLEYRTFLFDLLIQKREADFLKARPAQELWVKMFGAQYQSMQENYFSSEEFNNYPVNNISREAAQMYCVWLSIESRKYSGDHESNDFRLPARVEWAIAASAEGKHQNYPWTGDSVINASGCFMANLSMDEFGGIEPCDDKFTAMKDGESSAQYCVGGQEYTTKVVNFNPNDYGIFNMSGNVAEMVFELEMKSDFSGKEIGIGTAGGGWMNSSEELKINGPDPHEGEEKPHPNIGFRPVATFLRNK